MNKPKIERKKIIIGKGELLYLTMQLWYGYGYQEMSSQTLKEKFNELLEIWNNEKVTIDRETYQFLMEKLNKKYD